MAQDIATAREGAKAIGIGAVDVRIMEKLQEAADRCVKELGSIDFLMYNIQSFSLLISHTKWL